LAAAVGGHPHLHLCSALQQGVSSVCAVVARLAHMLLEGSGMRTLTPRHAGLQGDASALQLCCYNCL
jgi:hypothetical protein